MLLKNCTQVFQRFWSWTTQQRPHWKNDYKEAAVLFVVFGITGSSSVALVRPFLKNVFHMEGSLKDGPNSYRVFSILLVSPIYACVLLAVGTVFGRHNYFANMSRKILGRFIPSQNLKSKIVCKQAFEKNAKKIIEENNINNKIN